MAQTHDSRTQDYQWQPSAPGDVSFQTLSHAGLRVNAGGRELLCDPWLIGSCYWRSWWNYPPVPRALVDTLAPDFIYLTHLHWDHFQSASLHLFPRDTPVFVPYDRYGRMTRDLKGIGMTNIREVRHAERVELAPGLAIRSFHIWPFVTDSAVVIEAGDQVLLNANDAKFAGGPLAQIQSFYPKFDFAFRSHSSANSRANFHVIDAPNAPTDENEHYLRAFSLFMDRVKPRFAIPFASNSCLLHDDSFHMNHLVQTPLLLRDYFEPFARERGLQTELKIMIPGDRWSASDGFNQREHDYFTNREAHLDVYRARVQPTMEKQHKLEARIKVTRRMVEKFFEKLARDVPSVLMRPLRGREVLLVAKSETVTGFAVDVAKGTVRDVAPEAFGSFDMRVEFPALILRQSLAMNMFGHAGISKRVNFFATKEAMPALDRFNLIINLAEAAIFPLLGNFNKRAITSLLPRWREGLLYARMLVDIQRGEDPALLEEKYLEAA